MSARAPCAVSAKWSAVLEQLRLRLHRSCTSGNWARAGTLRSAAGTNVLASRSPFTQSVRGANTAKSGSEPQYSPDVTSTQLTSVSAAAAAAGAAAAVLVGSTAAASCDSGGAPSATSQVQQLWEEVLESVHRDDASADAIATECSPPSVTNLSGSVIVEVPVRSGVPLNLLERAVMQLASSHRAENSSRSWLSSSHMTVRETSEGRRVEATQDDCKIVLQRAAASADASIQFYKYGELTDSDHPLLSQLLLLANSPKLKQQAIPRRPGVRHPIGEDIVDNPELRQLQLELEETLRHSFGMIAQAEDFFNALERGPAFDNYSHKWELANSQETQPSELRAHGDTSREQLVSQLRELGALVHLPGEGDDLNWESMAGYEEQKQTVEDLVLLTVKHAAEFERVAQKTRANGTSRRPKAVLFTGPPGTGKTTCARIIAAKADIPLVYIPVENIVSKWYGESEKMLSSMLSTAENLGGCIIFLDEVDSLATARSSDMNEATRRVLGVLLRFIDGFKATDSIVVAATNRKQDLDAALLSRCDAIVAFELPDCDCRKAILQLYAVHLSEKDLMTLAKMTNGMSARDLRSICEVTERRWVSGIIRGNHAKDTLPPMEAYVSTAEARKSTLGDDPSVSRIRLPSQRMLDMS